jgi:hypothetical protein
VRLTHCHDHLHPVGTLVGAMFASEALSPLEENDLKIPNLRV